MAKRQKISWRVYGREADGSRYCAGSGGASFETAVAYAQKQGDGGEVVKVHANGREEIIWHVGDFIMTAV